MVGLIEQGGKLKLALVNVVEYFIFIYNDFNTLKCIILLFMN